MSNSLVALIDGTGRTYIVIIIEATVRKGSGVRPDK
jgi:hypothetical protein